MAKRKKTHKRPASRRRRISGIGGNMSELMGIALGAAAAPYVDKAFAKFLPSLSDKKILAAAKVAIGVVVLPKVTRNPMVNAAAKGIVAVSAVQLANSLGLYGAGGAGIGDAGEDVYVDLTAVNGVDDDNIIGMETVSGTQADYFPTINGIDDELYDN
jgi:hypothetical protein